MKLVVLSTLLLAASCSSVIHPPPISVDAQLETYKEASGWPQAEPTVLVSTALLFSSSGKTQDGLQYFHQLVSKYPERALLRIIEGMLHIQMADDIPLLRRVSWVDEGLAEMDAAVAREPIPGKLLRGLVEADLPARFNRASNAIADLEAALADSAYLPFEVDRGVHHAMAKAWTTLGNPAQAQAALRAAGLSQVGGPLFLSNASVGKKSGYRFVRPRTVEIAPKLWVFQGYDFANVIARETARGIILIDTGTTVANAEAVLRALRVVSSKPIHTIILTHSHWDHVGGVSAFLEPGTEVIASAASAEELQLIRRAPANNHWFFGDGAEPLQLDVKVTHVVNQTEEFNLADVHWQLMPVAGGETRDALVIFDPGEKLAFVGDVLMPYVGAPTVSEGSPDELVRTIGVLRNLGVTRLIHGHDPLTQFFTSESLPGLQAALQESLIAERELIARGRTAPEILRELKLPAALQSQPKAVLPYLVLREGLIQRDVRQRTGYWNTDIESIDPSTPDELAGAIDLVGGGSAAAFGKGAEALLTRGDLSLSLRIATLGLLKYSDDPRLQRVRAQVLDRLREKNQINNPFKFIIYSELAGKELAPVPPTTSPPSK